MKKNLVYVMIQKNYWRTNCFELIKKTKDLILTYIKLSEEYGPIDWVVTHTYILHICYLGKRPCIYEVERTFLSSWSHDKGKVSGIFSKQVTFLHPPLFKELISSLPNKRLIFSQIAPFSNIFIDKRRYTALRLD